MSSQVMTNNVAVGAEAERSDSFPAGVPFIVGNEGAERFSFYGMRAILYVYLTSLFIGFAAESSVDKAALADAKTHATQVAHLFMAGVYAFPMIGAILADRLLGKFKVILWVSLIYCAGHGVLAIAGRAGAMGNLGLAEMGMYGGLLLIAMGSGGIKPCVSANVGDQFTAKNGHLVSKVFQIFYFMINFGSFFSTLLIPYLYKNHGAEIAFGVPGILMAIATVVFWMGRNKFVKVPARPGGKIGAFDFISAVLLFTPFSLFFFGKDVIHELLAGPNATPEAIAAAWTTTYMIVAGGGIAALILGFIIFTARQKLSQDDGFLAVMLYAFQNQKNRKAGEGFFSVAKEKFGEEAAEGPPAVLRIMLVFSMVSVFWALFDQHSSTWIEQAKQMDLKMTVPANFGQFMLVGTILVSLYGLVWLLLWVSNVQLPKALNLAVGAIFGGGALIAAGLDMSGGEWTTFELAASQISALNPLMVMMIIPLLNVAVYRPLEKRGRPLRPLQKMTIGMFVTASAFGAAALLQLQIEARGPGQIHAMWQVVQYWLITTAEVLVSVTGLEFAYTQAPRRMKSTIMGFWLLCVTIGNLLVALLAPLQKLSLSTFFWTFTGLMLAAAVLFAVAAYFYKGKTYLQEASSH